MTATTAREILPSPRRAGYAPGSGLADGPAAQLLLWIGIASVALAIFVPLLMLMNQGERTVVADADLPVVTARRGRRRCVRPMKAVCSP
jgi:hypothetical protein